MNVSMNDRNKLRRKVYTTRKTNGVCTRCGNEPAAEGLECVGCAAKQAAYIQQRREMRRQNSLCIECGQPVVGRDLCDRHLMMRQNAIHKISDKRKKRRENGLCEQCGHPALDRPGLDYKVCETCYLKGVAKCNLGDIQRWDSLKSLLDLQQGRCPYTGEQLALGVNTTLDHKVPVSRGGDHSLSNIQWLYFDVYGGFDVNRMKGALTDQEYRETIRKQSSYLFS